MSCNLTTTATAAVSGTPASPETARLFRYWQWRTLLAAMFGYAAYYFVRKNLSVAMPFIEQDLGLTKADLGIFLSAHGVLYGLSRFFNGPLADRMNARYFMVAGLALSAAANIVFGLNSLAIILGLAWVVNGWVQGMGFPPVCRLMTHWFPPHQLARRMTLWNTSHSIGAWLALIACGYIVMLGWRWCFIIPGALCIIAALILFSLLRDTPTSVALPELQTAASDSRLPRDRASLECGGRAEREARSGDTAFESAEKSANHSKSPPPNAHEDTTTADYKAFVRKHVFANPYIWLIAFANFFVYVLRFAVLDWGPTLLKEMKNLPIHHASWLVAGFEAAGLVGMLLAGWITDRVFGGRGVRTCLFCMVGACAAMFLFWKIPAQTPLASALLLGAAGFFIYGPQALIAITAANLATRRAAATAAGLTGLFGYLSTILSGWGLGLLVQTRGWNTALGALIATGALGALMFILAWRAKPHGYDTQA